MTRVKSREMMMTKTMMRVTIWVKNNKKQKKKKKLKKR